MFLLPNDTYKFFISSTYFLIKIEDFSTKSIEKQTFQCFLYTYLNNMSIKKLEAASYHKCRIRSSGMSLFLLKVWFHGTHPSIISRVRIQTFS